MSEPGRILKDKECWRRQLAAISRAVEGGCQLVQIRERDLPAATLAGYVREAVARVEGSGARVLVNDRLDVALVAGADGVHLRTTSLRAADVRRVTEDHGLADFLIGVSIHSLREAIVAGEGGADFVVCGPVFDTPSKRGMGEPLGLERLKAICESVPIPVIALGGIRLAGIDDVLATGVAGIAAIGLFQQGETQREIVADILARYPAQ